MACLLVPAAEAVVTTIAAKAVKAHEAQEKVQSAEANGQSMETEVHIPLSRKLKWLSNLLWGGSGLLAFEHVWHGEITPFFPFLTAAGNPADMAEMLHEMSTVGVTMAALVTAVWFGITVVTSAMEENAQPFHIFKKLKR